MTKLDHIDTVSPQFGIIGVGRLGNALSKRCRSLNLSVPVWSRRYFQEYTASHENDVDKFNVRSFDGVASSQIILSAIPNRGLIELSKRTRLNQFNGVIAAMGIDTSIQPVRDAFPSALVVRTSPAIPQDGGPVRAISFLDPSFENDRHSVSAKSALEILGPVSWIANEPLYDLTTLMAGPLLTLIKSAVSQTILEALQTNSIPVSFNDELQGIVLNELSRRLVPLPDDVNDHVRERTTPGGVTEVALSYCNELSSQLQMIVGSMQNRFDELRAAHSDLSTARTPS